jgi:hypothetical protein
MHGKSFAPHLRGEDAPPLREFAICGSKLNGKDGRIAPQSVTPVLYTPEWAYAPIGPEGERELFALAHDPYAENNVAPAHPGKVKELHGLLLGWLRDVGAAEETIALLGSV